MVTGKKVRYVATMATPNQSALSPITMSGAMAMIGIVWLATIRGTTARSSTRTCTSTTASPSPNSVPITKPIAALRSVKTAAPARRCSVVAPTASVAKNSEAMSQVWGSLISVANGKAKGGLWSKTMPVPRNDS